MPPYCPEGYKHRLVRDEQGHHTKELDSNVWSFLARSSSRCELVEPLGTMVGEGYDMRLGTEREM